MNIQKIDFREWEFEVDKLQTQKTYERVLKGGSDECSCDDCKNYVAFRDKVFPSEILNLFEKLGIDYRKEVETFSYETLPNGLHHIGGWFHCQGKIKSGKDCRIPLKEGGYTLDLSEIGENFLIGFTKGKDLTFFENDEDLIQIEFDTLIPWVIDEKLETKYCTNR